MSASDSFLFLAWVSVEARTVHDQSINKTVNLKKRMLCFDSLVVSCCCCAADRGPGTAFMQVQYCSWLDISRCRHFCTQERDFRWICGC